MNVTSGLGRLCAGLAATVVLAGCSLVGSSGSSGSASPPAAGPVSSAAAASAAGVAAAAPSAAPLNIYAHAGPGMLSAAVRGDRPLIYVPNTFTSSVTEIDPATFRVVRTLHVGLVPQHVVPSWDLKTLWVNDNNSNDLVPIDARTGLAGRPVPVADPYNLYFSPDGRHALVMAERLSRIDVRDPHTMRLQHSLPVPCRGVNHADATADLQYFLVSCEFSGKLLVIRSDGSRIVKVIDLNSIHTPGATTPAQEGGAAVSALPGVSSMPQDVRLAPDGRTFLAADMLRNGCWLIDAGTLAVRGFLPTGRGAHGIYPSRDGTELYVSNRDEGSVSVVSAATLKVIAKWRIPGGGTPDMGGVTADGSQLWLSGRGLRVVYVFDTRTGRVIREVPVGLGPHGLCVWPQPGRFSLGHTGNMR